MEQLKQESWINNQVLIKYFNNELSYVEVVLVHINKQNETSNNKEK